MDISSFKLRTYTDYITYYKQVGDFCLNIYTGSINAYYPTSIPPNMRLDINDYSKVYIEIIKDDSVCCMHDVINLCPTINNLKPEHVFLSNVIVKYCRFFVSISELESIYDDLNKLTKTCLIISDSPVRQEKPCRNKSCGRLNDLGVSTCWWCEINNPTGISG